MPRSIDCSRSARRADAGRVERYAALLDLQLHGGTFAFTSRAGVIALARDHAFRLANGNAVFRIAGGPLYLVRRVP